MWMNLHATTAPPPRISTSLAPLDRALGGGIVLGEVILLAGDPGAGKSTLLLQVAARIPGAVYATAEERAFMVQERARRLGIEDAQVRLTARDDVQSLIDDIGNSTEPTTLLVVDSVQAFRDPACKSQPGTPNACRAVLARLIKFAALTNTAVFVVCQVTKGNLAAGPRALEHAVDASLHLNAFRALTDHRSLRTDKNRYGPSGGTEILRMTPTGMEALSL